jgi:DNA-binding response OmpR family regulator
MKTILIYDKDLDWRQHVLEAVRTDRLMVKVLETGQEESIPAILEREEIALVLADATQCRHDGLDLIETVRDYSLETEIIMFIPATPTARINFLYKLSHAYVVSKADAETAIGQIIGNVLTEKAK